MKFLSCHIVGFGKFTDAHFDFSKNPFVLFGENGYGKTTLTAFLECMLYGMDSGRSKNLAENPRVKYEPFTGGGYGGSLTLSHAGKTYRIERSFGKTPSADTTKIYDRNNMLCYDFGEKGETLGETLIGVNRESYRRSVYLPQNEWRGGGLPDGLRGKLLALLSARASDGNAGDALERLENAERALRAKRRPAKGKLDELDERLLQNGEAQTECIRAGEYARSLRGQIAEKKMERRQIKTELTAVENQLEECAKAEYRAAQDTLRADLQAQANKSQNTLNETQAFFKETSPKTVNVSGLKEATARFYELEEEIRGLQSATAEYETLARERAETQAKLSACQTTLRSFETLLKEKAPTSPKEKKPKKEKGAGVLLLLSIAACVFGAIKRAASPLLGWLCIVLGGALGLSALVGVIKNAFLKKKTTNALPVFENEQLNEEYRSTKAEETRLQSRLTALQTEIEPSDRARLELQEKQAAQTAVQRGIDHFLSHFPFGEIYDYRAAIASLEEKIARHETAQAELTAITARLNELPPSAPDFSALTVEDTPRLQSEKRRLQGVDERLSRELADLFSALQTQETRAYALADHKAEETKLLEEKTRLENRLFAIKTAKELLLRARANMATRYLDPVEKKCRYYLQEMGFALGESLRFTGDGEPLLEETGGFRPIGYYSEGLQTLIDFCVRVALFETALPNDCPLILDDPFENLDDEKCARAKALVKTLGEKRQVLYFTCKKERLL